MVTKTERLILENQMSIIQALVYLVDKDCLKTTLELDMNNTEGYLNPTKSAKDYEPSLTE